MIENVKIEIRDNKAKAVKKPMSPVGLPYATITHFG